MNLRGVIPTNRKEIISSLLLVNTFVWYFLLLTYLQDLIQSAGLNSDAFLIMGITFLAISISGLFSTFLSGLVKNRQKTLICWMAISTAFSILPMLGFSSFLFLMTFSISFGICFGIGIPICFGYFAASVESNNRGRLSGFVILLVTIAVLLFSFFNNAYASLNFIFFTIWRASGLVIFIVLLKNFSKIERPTYSNISYNAILRTRSFLLYFVPFCALIIVNGSVTFFFTKITALEIPGTYLLLTSIFVGIFAVVGGFLADHIGRKRLIMASFLILGVTYALLSLFYNNFTLWFYLVANGLSMGILYALFGLTLWGDLAQDKPAEKFYMLAILPLFITFYLQIVLTNYLLLAISVSTFFSLASILMFTFTLPILFAPETLSERLMKDRDLKNYVQKALKEIPIRSSDIEEDDETEKEDENEEESDEYCEAKRLAEKYY